MKCVHCGCILMEPVEKCPSCGRSPMSPDGFELDRRSGKYRMTANGIDKRTQTCIKVVTWYDPETGKYSQEVFDADENDAGLGVKELPDLTEKSLQADTVPKPDDEPQIAETPASPDVEPQQQDTAPTVNNEPQQTDIVPSADSEPQQENDDEVPGDKARRSDMALAADDGSRQTDIIPAAGSEPDKTLAATNSGDEPWQSEATPHMDGEAQQAKTAAAVLAESEGFVPREPALASYRIEKKSYAGTIAAIFMLLIAGLLAAGYFLGYFELLSERLGEQIEVLSHIPEAARIPVFSPLEPVEPIDELLDVPEDRANGENPVSPPMSRVNYYPQLANVSEFTSRALQDENHIYFLPVSDSGGFVEPADLTRVKIGSSKMEKVESCWPGEGRIYSFTLLDENIIFCASLGDSEYYGFFSAPKEDGRPVLLFTHSSPAFMTVFENKLYLMFDQERSLGVFDPQDDAPLELFELTSGNDHADAQVLPAFSVTGGHIYYGWSYPAGDGGTLTEYFKAGLDASDPELLTGAPETGGQVVNPVFDSEGNVYCGLITASNGNYSFCVIDNEETQIYYTFNHVGFAPIVAGVGDDGLIALIGSDDLTRYRIGDMTPEQDTTVEGLPYAATRDYLIAGDGLYLASDLSFTPFDPAD